MRGILLVPFSCKVPAQLKCHGVLAATLATAVWAAKWFYKIKPVAGYLLWPYVAFLTYANCLNYFHLKENGVSVLHACLFNVKHAFGH